MRIEESHPEIELLYGEQSASGAPGSTREPGEVAALEAIAGAEKMHSPSSPSSTGQTMTCHSHLSRHPTPRRGRLPRPRSDQKAVSSARAGGRAGVGGMLRTGGGSTIRLLPTLTPRIISQRRCGSTTLTKLLSGQPPSRYVQPCRIGAPRSLWAITCSSSSSVPSRKKLGRQRSAPSPEDDAPRGGVPRTSCCRVRAQSRGEHTPNRVQWRSGANAQN